MAVSTPDAIKGRKEKLFKYLCLCAHPLVKGILIREATLQPIPLSNMDICSALTLTLPALAPGQTNRPSPNRLEYKQPPFSIR